MKKLLWLSRALLFLAFNFFLLLTIMMVFKRNILTNDSDIPVYNGKEEFDPSLQRLSSVSKMVAYCDSLFEAGKKAGNNLSFENDYPALASSVARKRFYHGYSRYEYSNNYMALLLEPLTGKRAAAIVIPDDILKYPYGACSQQSLVMMELLKRKGFVTRRIGFDGGKEYGGHFTFEVFYGGSWHYFDPNQEPDRNLLRAYNMPGIAFLAQNKEIFTAAYKESWDTAKVNAMLLNYSYGKPNVFAAPNALAYQRITKFLSYTLWLFLLLGFVFVHRKYRKLRTVTANNSYREGAISHSVAPAS